MKKYKNILTILIVGLILSIGINVNAVEESRNNGYTAINIPIHKTDENGKALEGVEFTLTGFNSEAVSYKSTYEKDGDYLIKEATDLVYYSPTDYWWYNEEYDTPNNNIDFLPEKYQNMIKNIKSWDDVLDIADSGDFYVYQDSYSSYVELSIIFPVIIDETKVPDGYEKQKIVVPAQLYIEFNLMEREKSADMEKRTDYEGDLNDAGISIYTSIYIMPDDLYLPAGYFTYKDGVDYTAIFDKVNKKAARTLDSGQWGYAKYADTLKSDGFNTEKVDCSLKEEYAENFDNSTIMRRFDEDITNSLCVLQIEDKKIIVNPETSATVGVLLLVGIISFGLIFSKKLRKNN